MNIDLLIAKILQKEASSEEQKVFYSWLNSSKENKKYFKAIQVYYNSSTPIHSKRERNRWEQTLGKIYEQGKGEWIFEEQKSKRIVNRKLHEIKLFPSLRVVAALVIFLISSVLWWVSQQTNSQEVIVLDTTTTKESLVEKVAERGVRKSVKLSDGTQVKLNSDSKLLVPHQFASDKRVVYLEGEAFFDVVRDTLRPFIIHTKKFDVEVLGTSFNINSYSNAQEKFSSVAVVEGMVKVAKNTEVIQGDSSVVLSKGQMTLPNDEYLTKLDVNLDLIAWKDNILLFDTQSFDSIALQLKRWYGIDIEINTHILMGKGYKGQFKNATLESVLESMSFTLGFQYRYELEQKKVVIW